MKTLVVILLAALLTFNSKAAEESGHTEVTRDRVLQQSKIPVYNYKVVRSYPHDRRSYTEGLLLIDGVVYEGTGLYGHSKVLKWDLHSGRTLGEVSLDPHYFGEGVTVLNGAVYQLTYLENTAYVYDQNTLQRKGEFRYATQGWGLTNDGHQLLMSDGSSAILFLDPKSFSLKRRILVTDDVGPVGFLNELELAHGKLYASVWQTDFIAIIRPDNGKIIGWINLAGLNPEPAVLVYPYVLNGIAYDKDSGHLLVTGKCWPHVYEIELFPRSK